MVRVPSADEILRCSLKRFDTRLSGIVSQTMMVGLCRMGIQLVDSKLRYLMYCQDRGQG